MGDFNANAFHSPAEQFFIDMDAPQSDRWDVLAAGAYPATRLSGVPLAQRTSQIDYIIASIHGGNRTGLVGAEIAAGLNATCIPRSSRGSHRPRTTAAS